tara:strand:- start:858 stop:2216 length:1359 start_codon:yes stop_codon:yes gene_type:complete
MFYTATGAFSELIQGQMGNGSVTSGVLLKSFTKFSEGVLIFVIIAFGIVIMYHHALRKTYVYYITNQRCVFQGGIIKKIRRSIPYNKITDVEISQNIAERLLGITSINIHTASMGTHKSEISFVGLKDAETPLTDINNNMESGSAEKESKDKKTATLKDKLIKSRDKLGNSLSALLLGKKEINDDLLDELEMVLISADIGIQTTEKVLESVRKNASRKSLKDSESLYKFLKLELTKLLIQDSNLVVDSDKPFVILVVGVNGVGKTTTIGKMAKSFQSEGKTVMLAAGDTFRAAAVDQLKIWGERNKITVVSQKTGADSASVIYDAYESAKAKNINVLIADTAGRLHTQGNLMKELEKIKSVLKKNNANSPHETMLVIDGGSGQNAINQAKEFNKAVELSSISVTKLDGTAKGGVLFAISDELKLPIRYIGVGEGINDLKVFNASEFTEAIFD